MGMDLELEWEEPGWQRMMDSLPRGSVIPAERFFAMLGAVDEEGALEAALTLTARGVGLDVSRLPQGGPGQQGSGWPGRRSWPDGELSLGPWLPEIP